MNFLQPFLVLISTLTFFLHAHANISMLIVSSSGYCGERELAWRIKIAGENLGWNVYLDETEGGQKFNHLSHLDWVICLLPENKFFDSCCPNYLTVFHPFNYLDEERKLKPFYQDYDGYLLTIEDRETLADSLKAKNKELHCIPFYPSVYGIPYKKVTLNNIVTMIPVWSNRLTDMKFRNLYKLLSRTGLVKFYGIHKNKNIIVDGYMGSIPFDGVSFVDILQKHGIVLILHSDIHNHEGIPSSRIFEAAAASTVIISDENPFVKKHFGDSVFYIDTSLSAELIYNQIIEHSKNIQLHPERALEMAKQAHQIFMENFEMSDQLRKLEALHFEITTSQFKGGVK